MGGWVWVALVATGLLALDRVAAIGLGKHKRILRKIAGQLKSEKTLAVLQLSGRTLEGVLELSGQQTGAPSQQAGEKSVSEAFILNVRQVVASRELVQVKLKVAKKSTAKLLGAHIAGATDCLLAQVVGHSLLLYRCADPPGSVTDKLRALELEAEEIGALGAMDGEDDD